MLKGGLMARKRMIDPKFWTDDKILRLSHAHRLLFIGIWNFSDDSGIHKNDDMMLKVEIFPGDDISINEVGELKQGLMDVGLIIEFEDKENKLFYVKNWRIYQKINRPQPSNYSFTDNSLNNHRTFTPNRIEQNRTEQNGIKKKRTERSHGMKKGKYTLICQKCGSKYGTDVKDTYMVCRKCPDYPKMQIQ